MKTSVKELCKGIIARAAAHFYAQVSAILRGADGTADYFKISHLILLLSSSEYVMPWSA